MHNLFVKFTHHLCMFCGFILALETLNSLKVYYTKEVLPITQSISFHDIELK